MDERHTRLIARGRFAFKRTWRPFPYYLHFTEVGDYLSQQRQMSNCRRWLSAMRSWSYCEAILFAIGFNQILGLGMVPALGLGLALGGTYVALAMLFVR